MTFSIKGNAIVFSEKIKKSWGVKVYFSRSPNMKMTDKIYPVCSTNGNGSESLDWFEEMKVVKMYVSKPRFFGLFGRKTEEVCQDITT